MLWIKFSINCKLDGTILRRQLDICITSLRAWKIQWFLSDVRVRSVEYWRIWEVARRRRGKYKFNKSLAATQSAWIQKRARVHQESQSHSWLLTWASPAMLIQMQPPPSFATIPVRKIQRRRPQGLNKNSDFINITRYKVGWPERSQKSH